MGDCGVHMWVKLRNQRQNELEDLWAESHLFLIYGVADFYGLWFFRNHALICQNFTSL